MKPTKKENVEIEVAKIVQGRIDFCLLGVTPIIFHRMASKAMQELLMPRGKKTAADKAANQKHDPYAEFRDSATLSTDANSPTLLLMPAPAFKQAMAGAALDMPGSVAKSQIGRLARVEGYSVGIFGTPQIYSCIARMRDMNRTPDVRTRAIVKQWACRLTVSYTKPLVTEHAVANLLAAAGLIRGVGDNRVEKGKDNFGQFELVEPTDKRFLAVCKIGRAEQAEAMANPEAYDPETAELLSWYDSELQRRGKKEVS